MAPAIVALQRQAEEIRQVRAAPGASRLASLTAEQVAAVEALTRGLVNKFLHPPMQALKQAARENDSTRLDALCEAWSVSAAEIHGAETEAAGATAGSETSRAETDEAVNKADTGAESRR